MLYAARLLVLDRLALYSDGLDSHGLYSYSLDRYGICSYGLYAARLLVLNRHALAVQAVLLLVIALIEPVPP